MQIRKGGAWRTITAGKVFASGEWHPIVNGKCFIGDRWRDVCNFTTPVTPPSVPPPPPPSSPLSLTPSAPSIFGEDTTSPVTTSTVTFTPSGGLAPYRYTTTVSVSDGHTFTVTAPSSATTAVSAAIIAPGQSAQCTIQCVCQDSTGLTSAPASVSATMLRLSAPLGGGFIP